MIDSNLLPDYIFESSWEVCNKVGGIYTVLSTKADTLVQQFKQHLIYIGPDIWQGKENKYFIEKDNLFVEWRKHIKEEDKLDVRTGIWDIPGQPIVILVDFSGFYEHKNEIYTRAWELFKIDSLHGYGDYDEASMFSYAAGKVVESFYRYYLSSDVKVVYQVHEWMCGMGALFLQVNVPEIATIFTTHATSIGRSIAGNNKPLYDYLSGYNGDQMSRELNIESKHSVEKQTAHFVDCFTTVSAITDRECKQLLDKSADVILMNGFENDFVPKGATFVTKRNHARKKMFNIVNCLTGCKVGKDALIVGTSGRYEFLNKGINVFIDAISRLNGSEKLNRDIVAFINVPGWEAGPRKDLIERLRSGGVFDTALPYPNITHELHNYDHDQVMGMLNHLCLWNREHDKVKVVFVPCYLDGNDKVFDMEYYDVIIGHDLSVYPSYYEPWGYTPLESVAFHVPTVTTDLSGFGLWAKDMLKEPTLNKGVAVVHRSDYNYQQVVSDIVNNVLDFVGMSVNEVSKARAKAATIAEKALWKHFICNYYKAYDLALKKARLRVEKK